MWYFSVLFAVCLSICFCYYCECSKRIVSALALLFFSVGSRMTPTFKSKVLEFELTGEGNLPSVCVVRPALRNKGGSPMLLFRRLWVGRRHTLPLVLCNDGNVPAQVRGDIFLCPFFSLLIWVIPHSIFKLISFSNITYLPKSLVFTVPM